MYGHAVGRKVENSAHFGGIGPLLPFGVDHRMEGSVAVMAATNGRRTVDLGVRVEPDLREQIDFIARVVGISRNELVRRALHDYVANALEKA